MPFVAAVPGHWLGEKIGSGQCVAYVQRACGAPHTTLWRRGIKVRGTRVPTGTAIATFDPDGSYGNHTDGRSHAAILMSQTSIGLHVFDQWRGHPVNRRTIHFRGGDGHAVNDGDQFHVIEPADDDQPPTTA
jgi:hypothetical protein